MSQAHRTFIDDIEKEIKPLNVDRTHAIWDAATTGTPEASEHAKATEAAVLRFWADPERFAAAKSFFDKDRSEDPIEARQIERIYLNAASAQQDEETITITTQLETELRQAYTNFRSQIDHETLSNNELAKILSKSNDSEEVEKAWKAYKQIGLEVAETIRKLARVRNQVAQKQGYRDFFQKSLLLDEIDETHLLNLFTELEKVTTKPFWQLKSEIDRIKSKQFGIEEDELRPWHYGDPFFQIAPEIYDLDVDEFFQKKDPIELAMITYEGIGIDVQDIIERSDLYSREGKDQHAFSIDLDRDGDVRTLNNLEPSYRWNTTLLHELGHATYNKYIDPTLPWLLRLPSHSITTEAVAILMGSLTSDREWLSQILRVSEVEADHLAQIAAARERAGRLIFTRWCLVMTHFERAFYADPEQDLTALWWENVERFQFLRCPQDHTTPDWASKYHIALFPVYYQNYELGHLVTAQFRNSLQKNADGFVGKKSAGDWLVNRVLRQGAREIWTQHVESATEEPLNTRYFVESLM